MSHHFAVILSADVAHFSKFMEDDGEATVLALDACVSEFRRCIAAHHGHEFGSVGDSFMAEFFSPIEALRAARDIQAECLNRAGQPSKLPQLFVRIGLHEGDVISNGEGLYGDVVNTAARLQQLAKPGGITLSELVYQQVHKEAGFAFRSLGQQQLKNIAEPIRVYEVERQHRRINWRRVRLQLTPYKIAAAGVLGVVAAFAFFIVYLEYRQPALGRVIQVPENSEVSRAPANSIAVLPFINMSSDPEQEYFSDGITEEILNSLAQIPGLQVTSRGSSFKFKGGSVDTPTVARQLHVAYILEGSVRKSVDRTRIAVNLVDATTDKHLWSAVYERDSSDIFEVQTEISTEVVNAMRGKLGLEIGYESRGEGSRNREAYEAYLRGMYFWSRPDLMSIDDAIREFEKATVLDPEYSLAHAALANALLFARQEYGGNLTEAEAMARAAPHVERAISLEPSLDKGYRIKGLLLMKQHEPEQALENFRKAILLNPNDSEAYNWMAILLDYYFGRYAEGFAAREMTLRLTPLSSSAVWNIAETLSQRNRLDEASRELDKVASIYPSLVAEMRGWVRSLDRKWSNLLLGTLEAKRINPKGLLLDRVAAWMFAVIGLENEARAISPQLQPYTLRLLGESEEAVARADGYGVENWTTSVPGDTLGLALASAGDYASARPMLEEMWRLGGRQIPGKALFDPASAVALIHMRRDAGDEGGVSELVAALRDDVRRYREAGIIKPNLITNFSPDYEEGLADYFSGHRERGLALIAKAAEEGVFILPNEAYLQELYDDPGFAPILAGQQAAQAREREKFLAIVCKDNPFASVWQPQQETCEAYLAHERT